MKVEDIMSSPVWVVRPEDAILHARNEMISRGVKKLPVVDDDGRAKGIVSLWDIAFGGGDFDIARERNTTRSNDGHVADIMTRDPYTVEPGWDTRRILRDFEHLNIQSAPVVQNGVLQGIITETDLLRGLLDRASPSAVVGDVMTPEVHTVHRHTAIPRAMGLMFEHRIHQVPVEEAAGVLVGMVSLSNIVFGHWMEARQKIGKRITTVHKQEAGGRKGARHVEEVYAVVEDVMTQGVTTVTVDQGIRAAANILTHEGFNALPVLEGETPVGIVTRRDILRHLAAGTEKEMRASATYEGHRKR